MRAGSAGLYEVTDSVRPAKIARSAGTGMEH